MTQAQKDAAKLALYQDTTLTAATRNKKLADLDKVVITIDEPATDEGFVMVDGSRQKELMESSQRAIAGKGIVWKPNGIILPADPGTYDVESEIRKGLDGDDYTAYFAVIHCMNDKTKEKFDLRYKYKSDIEPDTNMTCVVTAYVAQRNWPSDLKQIIAKGEPGVFCVNG